MNIEIDGKFYLDKDDYCYTLKEHTGNFDKLNKEITKTYGYFTNLESALKKLKEIKTQESLGDTTTLADYIKELRNQHDDLIRVMEEI